MSTNLIPANFQVPAHLAGRVGVPSVLATSMVGGIGGGAAYPRISIKGSRFRIVEGDSETVLQSTEIDVVIVGANPRLSKTFYAKQWTPDDEPTAPDCQSLDGISPDPESSAPQNDLCASCPQNAWGSKITPQGKETKACADQKRLAVVAADDASGPIYLMQVTPAALKGLNQYQKELSVRGIPPEIVKTKVSFDTDASFPLLKFSFGGFLDPEQQAVVDGLFGTPAVMEVTGEGVVQKPAAVPAIAAPKAAPVVAPKPVVVEEPAAAPVEPVTTKRGFGAAKTTTKPKAAHAVAQPAAAAPAAPVKAVKTVEATAAAASLADEIAALVGEVAADDA
jgi:hypothetical protein